MTPLPLMLDQVRGHHAPASAVQLPVTTPGSLLMSLNDTHLQKQWYRQCCDGFDQRKQTEGVIAPVKTVRSIPLTNECECDVKNMDHSSGTVALSSTDCSSVIFLLTVGGRLRIKQFVFVFTVLRPEDRSCETLMLPFLLLCILLFLMSSLLQMKSSGWIFVSAQCSEESRWGGGLEFDVYDARPQTLLDLKGSGRVTVTLESQRTDIFGKVKASMKKNLTNDLIKYMMHMQHLHTQSILFWSLHLVDVHW